MFPPLPTPTTFAQLVAFILMYIGYLIPFMLGVVFVIIVWKIFNAWVLNADDPDKQAEGRTLAITAVIVFVIMISAWGIVALLRRSLFGL
jgi:hypothetical protein